MAPRTRLLVVNDPLSPTLTEGLRTLLLVGRADQLRAGGVLPRLGLSDALIEPLLERARPGDNGASQSTFVGRLKVVVAVLPEACSRHNSPTRAWAVPGLVRGVEGEALVVLCLDQAAHAPALTRAVARALPLFDATSGRKEERTVRVAPVVAGQPVPAAGLQASADAVRLACRLVDTPTDTLHTDAFVAEAQAVAARFDLHIEVIAGPDLAARGFGGLWGVGKAATHGPALVCLRWAPPGATRTVAWVGKGVVYDTGGLSLKEKTSMVGMKGDMGGAAAVLAAFVAAVEAQVDYGVLAVLCLAENAVGPEATRPDDILTLYSGKTVEVNNTDAEGRLVLADGLAWVCEAHNPDVLIDLATLTGAALVATGKVHAAIVSNDEGLEAAAVAAGLRAGEPVFPLLYAPELLRRELRSPVADMRNSVKDRNNAQSSCAAQFIANHLPSPAPRWLHVDLAGPAWDGENRGTGYGVGLLLELGACLG